MAFPHTLEGPNGDIATITPAGQQVVTQYAYDGVYNIETLLVDTAYNLAPAKVGWAFVITGLMFTAKKGVTTDVLVSVYEAVSPTSITVLKDIMPLEMLKSTTRDVLGMNYLVVQGRYINAKADDTDTLVTMLGYYIPG